MSALITSGCSFEELGRHDEVGRDEVAVGPQVGLVDEHVAAAFEHEAGGPRLGHPGAVEGAGLEGGERVGVVLRRDVHVAAAAACRSRSPRRAARPAARRPGCCRATGWRAWRRRGRPGSSMPSRTTSDAPPDVVPATMRMRLAVGLGVAVDRRVRADEAGVDGAGEDRLDDLGAGVERRRLERGGRAERIVEQPGVDADDRRRVGDVREVAEAQGHVGGRGVGWPGPPSVAGGVAVSSAPVSAGVASSAARVGRRVGTGRRFGAGRGGVGVDDASSSLPQAAAPTARSPVSEQGEGES